MTEPSHRSDEVADRVLLGVLAVDGALLGLIGLLFNPLYYGPVPVPMGALLSVLILPWLVMRAADIDPRAAVAAAPLVAWVVAVLVVGLVGPGGDVLLPESWQSVLLCTAGPAAGLWALLRVQQEAEGR